MNEQKESQLRHEDANRQPLNPARDPYWKRMHRDWRIWVGVVLMLTAMVVYIMTGDLRWTLNGHTQPAVPAAVGQ